MLDWMRNETIDPNHFHFSKKINIQEDVALDADVFGCRNCRHNGYSFLLFNEYGKLMDKQVHYCEIDFDTDFEWMLQGVNNYISLYVLKNRRQINAILSA